MSGSGAQRGTSVSSLQGDAWAAWNASYHEPNAEIYRVLARTLYQQDLHERIMAQFAALDEQNAQLDALLIAEGSSRRNVTHPERGTSARRSRSRS
jgi:hypothetical protein